MIQFIDSNSNTHYISLSLSLTGGIEVYIKDEINDTQITAITLKSLSLSLYIYIYIYIYMYNDLIWS